MTAFFIKIKELTIMTLGHQMATERINFSVCPKCHHIFLSISWTNFLLFRRGSMSIFTCFWRTPILGFIFNANLFTNFFILFLEFLKLWLKFTESLNKPILFQRFHGELRSNLENFLNQIQTFSFHLIIHFSDVLQFFHHRRSTVLSVRFRPRTIPSFVPFPWSCLVLLFDGCIDFGDYRFHFGNKLQILLFSFHNIFFRNCNPMEWVVLANNSGDVTVADPLDNFCFLEVVVFPENGCKRYLVILQQVSFVDVDKLEVVDQDLSPTFLLQLFHG